MSNQSTIVGVNQLAGDRGRTHTHPHAVATDLHTRDSQTIIRLTMDNFQVVDFSSLSDTVQNLIKAALEARKRSYSPYSNFKVGAALLTEEDSKVFTGCNIESATFTPSLCAERAAIPKAVSEGYLKYKKVAVVAHQQDFTAPCGVCRQMLSEFRPSSGDMEVYLSKPTLDKVLCTKLSHLLPLSYVSFTEDNIVT